MKFKKLTFLVLASMAMGALAACGGGTPTPEPTPDPQPDPMPTEYDISNYWAGNEAEEYYTVGKEGNAVTISYADVTGEEAGGWAYVARSFAYDAAKVSQFNVYKKVHFEGKLEKTSGTDIVMVKVEGTDGNQWEKRFTFAAEVKSYEFSLSFISDWSKVSQILFFVNRSTNESGSGKITLNKMVLSQEAVNADYDIAPGSPAVPQGYAIYDGLAEGQTSFDVMYHWGYSSDGNITTTPANGGYKFTWSNQKGEWENVTSRVKNGKAALKDSGLKRLVFEITGTAGVTAVLKLESEQNHLNKEAGVTFTGEKQIIEIDATSVLAGAEETSYMALIFPEGGKKGDALTANAEIVLEKCYFDTTAVYVPANYYLFPHIWIDEPTFVDPVFSLQFDKDKHESEIDFALAATPDYKTVQYDLKYNPGDEWFGAENYTRVYGVFTASVNVQILVKPFDNGAAERRFNLVAGEPQIIDYSFDASIVDMSKKFVLFIGTGEGDALTGKVMVDGLRLLRNNANPDDLNGVVQLAKVNNTPEQQTVAYSYGDIVITTNFTDNGYRAIEMFGSSVKPDALNTLKGTIIANANTHVLLKACDNAGNERMIEVTAGEETEFEQTLTVLPSENWGLKMVFFIGCSSGDPLQSTVIFRNFRLTDGTHDNTFVAFPSGMYYGVQEMLTAPETYSKAPMYITFAQDRTMSMNLALTPYNATVTDFNNQTGLLKFSFKAQTGEGTFVDVTGSCKYDEANNKLVEVGLDGDAGGGFKWNFGMTLAGNIARWDCDGTADELKAQFNRRYGDPWTIDTGNADRFASVEQGIMGKAMSVRAWTGGRYSFAPKDSEQAFKCKNISFFVYNGGEQDVTLRMWGYKAKSFGSNFEIGSGVTAKKGTWTFISMGFTEASIYSFQIADFTKIGTRLVFDEIILY